jgi:hypothetical protein
MIAILVYDFAGTVTFHHIWNHYAPLDNVLLAYHQPLGTHRSHHASPLALCRLLLHFVHPFIHCGFKVIHSNVQFIHNNSKKMLFAVSRVFCALIVPES